MSSTTLHAAASRGTRAGPVIGLVSTYPPTTCGLATFSAALADALRHAPAAPTVDVVQATSEPIAAPRPEVVAQLVTGTPGATARAARALDRADVVVVQHEYGIYGGPCGEDVLDLLAALRPPTVAVAHTVLARPSPMERSVLSAVAEAADEVVTMGGVARDRLVERYGVDAGRVSVIPHGVTVAAAGRPPLTGTRPTLMTWGLLGPGKGIEWAIEALALLRDLEPAPRYVVAGRTHPKVLEREGEQYRDGLRRLARDLGVGHLVEFDDRYHDRDALQDLVRTADVVVLPYDSTEQVTSGVLVDAIACGRPVVASAFPHATELLTSGSGLVVPHQDPVALATALRQVLTTPGLAAMMADQAAALAPSFSWPSVAERYLALADRLGARRVA